ncbi:M23 family metallopeptidase [Pseudonocardia xinjiangensis]|uniref:M23 family metallopeptidase n=1 Tax=Pseudonocardia xinjiangensis TaxID=75289 RepID=UPI003D89B66E
MAPSRRGTAVAGLLATGAMVITGCVAAPEPAEPGVTPTTSPISGETRTTTTATALTPLLVTARGPVVPFTGSDGKVIVTYELALENTTPLTLTPTKVEVLAPSGAVLQTLDQAQAAAALAQPTKRGGVQQLTEAQTATLYVTLEFGARPDVPDRLDNRITVSAPGLPAGTATAGPVPVTVSPFPPPVLGPPLEPGTRYIAADSCCDSPRHRRAPLPIDNRVWLAQRFAVDWEQLDDRNRTVTGENPADPADYTIYGKRTIAAADGTVTHVENGLPDQKPGALPATTSPAQADGNSVVIDIGGGLHMLYAHMQNGSIVVNEGQRVTRGEQLGLVGNSGNTSAPHLHFHVMDGPSPLTSEGVPYTIDSFATTGEITSTAAFDELENTTRPLPVQPLPGDGRHRDQMPLDRVLVTFS